MQRDMQLIRKLLLFFAAWSVEEYLENHDFKWVPPIEDYDKVTLRYHLLLLHQAGLLDAETIKSETSDRTVWVVPINLTWQGHEFLDKVRDEKVWQQVKTFISAKGGSIAFATINQIVTYFALESAKSFTGP